MAFSFYHEHYGLLNRWAARINENAWIFNQVEDPTDSSSSTSGYSTGGRNRVYYQVHREAVAEALGKAFDLVSELLGYYPKPTFTYNEVIKLDERKHWFDQEITLPRRKLIQFGKATYSEYDVSITQDESVYAPILLEDNSSKIPGYRVFMYLPNDIEITTPIHELKDRFHVTLTGVDSSYPMSAAHRDILQLSQLTPYIITREQALAEINTLTGSSTWINGDTAETLPKLAEDDNDVPVYVFHIPAWELFSPTNRFNELLSGTDSGNDLEYVDNESSWESRQFADYDDPDRLSDIKHIEITQRSISTDGAIKLLQRPTGQADSADIVKTNVDATITNYNLGKFYLKRKDLSATNVYPPYAVEVSYQSGLDYQKNGNMNATMEQAIVALANTYIADTRLPVSASASTNYNEHRSPVYDDNRNVRNPNFLNPLGQMIGHSVAWNLILPKADYSKGTAFRL